jgi:DNA modification methylase/ParB-like chromosome segregation protein Spo0J
MARGSAEGGGRDAQAVAGAVGGGVRVARGGPVSATLQRIPIDQLHPHPDNPRLVLREDVVASITAQLEDAGAFADQHALWVRPLNGSYQIISGHQRTEAAKRAQCAVIPCWVQEMTDDEARMGLALSNSEEEWASLEYGLHVLRTIPIHAGGRGKTGGLEAYARLTGRNPANLSTYRKGATLLLYLRPESPLVLKEFRDKALHFAAIADAPQELWQLLVDVMLAHSWSAVDTAHWVKELAKFEIPAPWDVTFLPWPRVAERFLQTHEFSPATVQKLIATAERTETIIASYAHAVDVDAMTAAYRQWLRDGAGDYAWDVRNLVKRQREILAELERAELQAERRWNLGDWRAHLDAVPDGSVALLLTDPPYGIDYQSDYRLDRREDHRHERIVADETAASATVDLAALLAAMLPKLATDAHLLVFTHWRTEPRTRALLEAAGLTLRGSLVWDKAATGMGDPSTTFAPQHERILHAVKGSPLLLQRASDVFREPRTASEQHPTEKPLALLKRLIEATTVEGELVVDPYGGIASTLVAARQLGRECWGCEIDETYYRAGLERLEAAPHA